MAGTHSSRRINALAAATGARRYLEVGVNKGDTFLAVEIAERTAVDPAFRFDWQAAATPATRFHQQPSDAFFARCRERFDIVFLDGLHVFAQTFRDFCNALDVTDEGALILIDDTVPDDVYSSWPHPREAQALRRQAGVRGGSWHGDVFKMVFAIHDFFPRLSYVTIGTEGNPQTLVWHEPRTDFRPLFNSLEAVSRMSWFEMRRHRATLRLMPEPEALALATSRFAAR